MSDDQKQQQQFESLLVEFHEQLLAGHRTDPCDDLPVEIADRLRGAQDCVARLHALWAIPDDAVEQPAFDRSLFGEELNSLCPAKSIGRFKIDRELGLGGSGIVFLAVDPQLDRQVALKVPRPEGLVSRQLRERFLREAEAAARLSHRHIVTVYEVGEAGPICYIASEYCAGMSLGAWLASRQGDVSPDEAAALVADLAAAVHHAHVRGVLHRDLKPSNVLLAHVATESKQTAGMALVLADFVPKVADFGLAKLLEREGDETRTGTVLGTPQYMAPEQAEGRVRDIGVHSDVYALGAILYEVLTGAPPYAGATDSDTLRRVMLAEPLAPRKLRSEIPRDLEAICLKCLEKNPQDRYGTAGDLENDLRRFLDGRPTLARPLGAAAHVWKWTRRRPLVAGLSGVLAAALVTIVAGAAIYHTRLRTALVEVTEQREAAQESARRSRQLLYTADMRRAFEAWKNESATQVLEILEEQIPRGDDEDHREFSWYFLKGLCHQQRLNFAAHKGDVFSVAWSPDGRLLASAGKDHTVRIWDARTGQSRGVMSGHSDEVTSVAFSPAGDVLASASEDRTVRLWSIPEGAPHGVLHGHENHVMCLAYSPDGHWLASGSRDHTVRVWNPSTGDALMTLPTAKEFVSSVAFTRDGKLLIAGDGGGVIYTWQTETWRRLKSLTTRTKLESENMLALAHSPRRDWIAGGGRRNVVYLWDTKPDGIQPMQDLVDGHAARIQALAFSPTADVLASADKRGVIQLWNMDELGKRRTLLGHQDRVWSVAWSPDGQQLASGSADGTIWVWDAAATHRVESYASLPAILNDLTISPDGRLVVASCHDGSVHWFDAASQQRVRQYEPGEISWTRLSPDGRLVGRRFLSGDLHVFSRKTGEEVLCRSAGKGEIGNELAWSADSRSLMIDTKLDKLTVIDSRSGEIKYELSERRSGFTFSPDGRHIATTGEHVRIWNTADQKLALEIAYKSGGPCYAADSRLLVCEWRGTISIINTTTGELLRELSRRTDHAAGAISPDGKTIAATIQSPASVTLWDVRTGQELMSVEAPAVRVTHLLFSPQGDRLIGAGQDQSGRTQLWQWKVATTRPMTRQSASQP